MNGDAAVLAQTLGLKEADVAPYLARWHGWHERAKRAHERARPSDEFTRWEDAPRSTSCARFEMSTSRSPATAWNSRRPSGGRSGRRSRLWKPMTTAELTALLVRATCRTG